MHELFDEQDLALLHALQIAPRCSWTQLARVLGASAATVADRWARLRSEGLAWVTVHAGRKLRSVAVGFVEVDVSPPARYAVIEKLCSDPRAVTIEETSTGRDLMVTVLVPDHDTLTRFVLDDLPRIPGVERISTQIATKMHWDGSRWRLDALNRAQQAALQSVVPRHGTPSLASVPDAHRPLVEALAYDGRRSAAELARIVDRNPATVRRQLGRLLGSAILVFRCEVAQVRSQWPLSCIWFAEVPTEELDRTVTSLTSIPELRMCFSIIGRANLMFQLMVRSPGDLVRLERLMHEKLPWMRLVESTLSLRSPKRMGWVLDDAGRSTGKVVVPSVAHP